MASELRDLIKLARDHGYSVEQGAKSHWIFRDPQGRKVAVASHSASDTRSLQNTRADLRRSGLPVPHKGGRTRERNQA